MKTHQSQCNHKKSLLHHLVFFSFFMGYFLLAYWLLIGQFNQISESAYVSGDIVNILPQNKGYLTNLLVKENELVIKGQPVATVDRPAAYLKLKNAEMQLVETIKQANEMNKMTIELQNKVKLVLQTAEHNLFLSQKKYKEYLDSYSKHTLPLQIVEQAQIAVEKAADTLEDIRLEYKVKLSIPVYHSMAENPMVNNAMAQLRFAYLNWIKSTIYAPATGYITITKVIPGQAVNLHTVLMSMVPLNEMWINANIKTSQLKNITNGESVKLVVYLGNQKKIYKGIVVGCNSKIENSSSDFTSVRVRVDPEQFNKYPLRLGLIMTATINTRNHYGKPLSQLDKNVTESTRLKDYREELAPANQIIDKIVQDNTQNYKNQETKTRLGSL
jgi:membrane fusion protein (multidrug efflux system)